MGMFDYVIVPLNKLPVSESEAKNIGDKHLFQTKDFDCIMTEIYITEEGLLKVSVWSYETVPVEERPYPNAEGLMGLCGMLRRTGEHLETINMHGYLNFYTIIGDDDWLEFNAKFTDGRLETIERVTPMLV